MIQEFAKRAAPIAVLMLGTSLSGCGFVSMDMDWDEVEGVPLAELDMSGDAPDEISLAGPDSLIITEGDGMTITLDGDSEAGDALRFDLDGDELTIARDNNVYDGSKRAIVRLTIPAPETLGIAGSGDIESATMASRAEIEIAGSGSITVAAIDAEDLDVAIAGSGDVSAAGSAQSLDVSIAGTGNVRLGELMADNVSVSIAGSGNVDLASNGRVDGSIAGSGNITVTGSATCSVDTAGSGKLTCNRAPSTADADPETEVVAELEASAEASASEDESEQ